jgi:hypothetical protein
MAPTLAPALVPAIMSTTIPACSRTLTPARVNIKLLVARNIGKPGPATADATVFW